MATKSSKKTLPARPNLDHLRTQAKTLLTQLHDGAKPAAQAFIDHLPEARGMKPPAVRAKGFRLADAQSVVARQTGFASWPALSRHVQQLRGLEGEWHFASLEVDGASMPAAAMSSSRMLIDGDRFRMESPEANYEGIFTIDVEATPPQIDIEFVEGPEAGNWCYGLYDLKGDELTFCLGLVGSERPTKFATSPGSGHALERLTRVSAARPADVKGGTRPAPAGKSATAKSAAAKSDAAAAERVDPTTFDVEMTPMLRRLEGDWTPVQLVMGGQPMQDAWLAFGVRTTVGNEVKVVFGGQVMVHAKVRVDERATPIAVDYLNLNGAQKGRVSPGIMEWIGEEVRFLTVSPGQPRPADFSAPPSTGTLSQWRRKT